MSEVTGTALVLNCGSSSVKYAVVDVTQDKPLVDGIIERVTDHGEAIHEIILTLSDAYSGVDLEKVDVIGHRVVQGGSVFSEPTVIDDDVIKKIADLSVLAPLHNPGNVAGIKAARASFPGIPQVAVFDTAFHATMPPEAYTYAIPKDLAEKHAIRRYGMHGTSHKFVSRATAEAMGKAPEELNTIVLHIGNGASATAVQAGTSVDTSMGLTPLEGLVMGTRSGDIDPAVFAHIARQEGITVNEVDLLLNKQSGMLGLTGMSDMRDIENAAKEGHEDAELALKIYSRRIKGYVGRYMALMGHVDAITFTAGVGENDTGVRLRSMSGLENFGIHLDPERNDQRCKVPTLISTDDSPVQVWVIPTNEELEIALESLEATQGVGGVEPPTFVPAD